MNRQQRPSQGHRSGPLSGRRILITRAIEQAEATAEAVQQLGGEAVLFPCLQLQCLSRDVRREVEAYIDAEWLFTSRNGVTCVAETLGNDLAAYATGRRVAAVGEKTAEALRGYGLTPSLVADEASQEGLWAAYQQLGLPEKLLFFRAEEGRDMLSKALTDAGCQVTMLPVYRSVCPSEDASEIRHQLCSGNIDAVLFGSPKTVRHYVQRIGDAEAAGRPLLVAISQQVAEAAREAGLQVQLVAESASFQSMLEALASYFQGEL